MQRRTLQTNLSPEASRGGTAACATSSTGQTDSKKEQGFVCVGVLLEMEFPASGIKNYSY